MDFRRLGDSGLAVSVVGLGTNNLGMKLDLAGSREVVHAALDQGITLFDTADSYGASEERLGELLDGARDDVVLATKFGSDVRPLLGRAVGVSGVEQRDAGVQGGVHDLAAARHVEAHPEVVRAQPDDRDDQTGVAEATKVHALDTTVSAAR